MINKTIVYIMALAIVGLSVVGIVSADPSPNGPGQPGALPNGQGTHCGDPGIPLTPGGSISALGSPFNPNGIAGMHYAGNPDTASSQHANSPHAISEYDIACYQVSQSHP